MSKRTDVWLTLVFCLLLACNCMPAALAKGQAQTVGVLKLEQTHCTIDKIEVLLSNQAVKIKIKKSDTFLIARAPTWKVVWYRNDPKTAFEISFSEWCTTGTKLVPIGTFRPRPFKQEGVTKISGESIVKLSSNERKKLLDFWLVDDRTRPQPASDILISLFRLPPAKGVPYKFKVTYLQPDVENKTQISWIKGGSLFEKEEGTRLYTTKMSRVTVPSSEFDYPQNYKLVKQEQQVWLTSGTREAVDDLLNMPTLEYKK